MNGSTKEPDSPAQPTTLLASFCSVLLLLRRRLALPSSSSPSTSLVTILDRSLGAAVTLGLSLAILKWVATKHTNSDGSNAKPTRRSLTSDTKNDYSSETKFNYSSSGLPSWLEELIRWILPFGYYSTSNCNEDDDETSTNEEIIIHTGSCHCQSIVFQWKAQRVFPVQEGGPGKIRYRHTQIDASTFRLLAGSDCLQTYYVVAPSSTATTISSLHDNTNHLQRTTGDSSRVSSWDQKVESAMRKKTRNDSGDNKSVGAHSFCRRCGVHILFAPSSYSSKLEINVDCSEEDPSLRGGRRYGEKSHNQSRSTLNSCIEENSISRGSALPGQWQPQPQTPPRPQELKGVFAKLQLSNPQHEIGPAFTTAVTSGSLLTEPVLSKTSDSASLWEPSFESKPHLTKLQSPDTPSTIATSCDGLTVPASSLHEQSVGGDASSSFAEDMLSSTSSSSGCDGEECANNDLVSNLVWNVEDHHDSSNPSPLSQYSNLSAVTVSVSSLPSTTSSTIATPMLRDQLKYYMSRHIGKPKKAKGNNEL